ncbi:Beta-galactosidase BoGH2A [subsurface metagenome]
MKFPEVFPGKKFIASETTSAIATRGHYDMPSDTIRRWPSRELIAKIMKLMKENHEVDFEELFAQNAGLMNADFTCSSCDNCSVPWGSTHEETWKIVKKYDFISGMFIWTGFDYLGEPTPYPWPARSSYFGIIDLAGFPKDAYYMYQSEWTNTDVLHIFPHWNWEKGDTVDVWAYTNCGEVELFLNDKSLGTKTKQGDELHLIWKIPFVPGTLKAIGRTDGKEIMTTEVKTAGPPAKIILEADRSQVHADGKDLSFVTVTIVDKDGTMVPDADNLVRFKIDGNVTIAGVDNGSQISHEPFKADSRKAFNGKCLVVLQSSKKSGQATIITTSEGLDGASVIIETK